MNQALISFLDNMPVGIPKEQIHKEIVKYLYVQYLKLDRNLIVLANERTHLSSVSGITGLFLRLYWNG